MPREMQNQHTVLPAVRDESGNPKLDMFRLCWYLRFNSVQYGPPTQKWMSVDKIAKITKKTPYRVRRILAQSYD